MLSWTKTPNADISVSSSGSGTWQTGSSSLSVEEQKESRRCKQQL